MFLFFYHNGHTFPTQVNSSIVTVFSRSIKDGRSIITSLFNTQRMVGWKRVKEQTPLVFILYDFSSVISSPESIINLVPLSLHKVTLVKLWRRDQTNFIREPRHGFKTWKNWPKFSKFQSMSILHAGPLFLEFNWCEDTFYLLNDKKKRDIVAQCFPVCHCYLCKEVQCLSIQKK